MSPRGLRSGGFSVESRRCVRPEVAASNIGRSYHRRHGGPRPARTEGLRRPRRRSGYPSVYTGRPWKAC
ncbi:hypothetical protein TVNIR_1901 [Thioalkalivibrio nitratireducens DSM 14787]|uniref:Uncharacterized protein n=1 Tax=Thioalkalivibrio nitratireducens (strain DSM 14787 / UNIQEM 213 / ALEN2) TaxID=1255043 RepID=L0DX28_THIND|nr:hypothetical protein TVNIR_1901 [Thioalkalivibrio nitratireducens DSM 14787]